VSVEAGRLEAGEWCSVSKIDENRPFTTIVVVVSWWRCPDHDVVARCQVLRLGGAAHCVLMVAGCS